MLSTIEWSSDRKTGMEKLFSKGETFDNFQHFSLLSECPRQILYLYMKLCIRVQWFWNFFYKFNMLNVFLVWPWNPKTSFLKYWTVSIYLTFYPSKKVAPPPLKSWKKFIGRAGYQKKQNFALISKMWRSLEFGKREKKFYRKT